MSTIPPGTSLLLTLLTTDEAHEYSIKASNINQELIKDAAKATEVQRNIDEIVKAMKPPPGVPNLVRNVAMKKLYDVLYEIIEKQYKEPEHEPETEEGKRKAEEERKLNQTFAGAIGIALEEAITGKLKDDSRIKQLREELRKEIIEALTPK